MAQHSQEVEIKFAVDNIGALTQALLASGFRLITERTRELNTLYDRAGFPLRKRGAILRLRQYGPKWTLTYKDKRGAGAASSLHKSRREIETELKDGQAMDAILVAAGFKPAFAYEKFRSEWTDDAGSGHVVIDETPLGNFGEIEGPSSWIDRIASQLGIRRESYITASYAELFLAWKRKNRHRAKNMLFAECG